MFSQSSESTTSTLGYFIFNLSKSLSLPLNKISKWIRSNTSLASFVWKTQTKSMNPKLISKLFLCFKQLTGLDRPFSFLTDSSEFNRTTSKSQFFLACFSDSKCPEWKTSKHPVVTPILNFSYFFNNLLIPSSRSSSVRPACRELWKFRKSKV